MLRRVVQPLVSQTLPAGYRFWTPRPVTGTATDLDIRAKETIRLREELNGLYAHHTGQDVEKVAADTDRDFFMSAEEAKLYGLIDDVITTTAPAPNGQVKNKQVKNKK